jgi:hypothetical protein
MTLHIPLWYLAMIVPALAHYTFTLIQVARQSTLTGVTDQERAAFVLGMLVGGIQSGLLWPLYLGNIAVVYVADRLSRRERP